MNEPKRWSENGSEVDPVLRSVLRYAQDQGPDPAQLQRILRGASSASERPPTRPPRPARAFLSAMAAGLSVALGGLAWASYVSAPIQPRTALPSALAVALRAAPKPRPRTPPPVPVAPTAAPSHAPATAPAPSVTPAPSVAPATSADVRDATWLAQARSSLSADPARALVQLRDHQVHFPTSPLGEERAALQIEALSRLGRTAEAASQLDAFETRFPRSPYRRRLHALVSP